MGLKRLIVCCVFFVGILSIKAQIAKVMLKDYKLKSSVKSVKEYVFDNVDGDSLTEFNKLQSDSYQKKFNTSGYLTGIDNVVRSKSYHLLGTCLYGKKNRIEVFKMVWKQYKKRRFNVNKRPVSKDVVSDIFQYNDFKPIVVIRKIKNDKLYTKKMMSFNSNLQPVEVYLYEGEKDKKTRELNQYDENGNLTSMEYFNFFTKETVERTFSYDDRGNVIEEQVKVPNGKTMKTLKKYNKHNDLIEETAFLDGKKYVNKSTYTYDNRFNYIMKIEITNDLKKIITKRVIEYY